MTLLETRNVATEPPPLGSDFSADRPAPAETLLQLLFAKHITYSLSAVARLGVPDHMSDTPASVEDLAGKPARTRLRFIASCGP